jgi:hypothetical protein
VALNTSRTRAAKTKAHEEYTATDKEVKRSIWKDKQDYIDSFAKEEEKAARQASLREL